MSDFEDKLNKILSSPEDMEKILDVARSLAGSGAGQSGDDAKDADTDGKATDNQKIDPKMIKLMTRLMGEYSSPRGDKSELISAIKPYLKEERRADLDRAAQIAKLAKLARTAFSEFSGGDSTV